ncbi:MAG: restriction endonuclease subunit S [Burkholderiales bacterium]|nr:restriction endonuclease subunit S [Burkholderiales bacterium]
MKWQAYPKYKPSGVEWLGELPKHWDALPLKRRHHVVNGGTPSSSEESYWDGEIIWITPEDLGRNNAKRIGESRRTLSFEGLDSCGAQLVPSGSIVLSTRAPIGHVAITVSDACTNQGCRALVQITKNALPEFVYYVLVASRPVLQATGKGTTFMELGAGALGSHPIPLPSSEEQLAIANFLDRETAKIDTLVEKKRTLIERLREKRVALISRTVTKGLPPDAARAAGLDPHPKLKPSGIDWLGEVPAHWDVKRGRFCMLVNPPSERLRKLSEDDEVSFVPMEAVGEYGGLNLDTIKPLGEIGSNYTEFQDGDVVVAKITPCFENGKGALAAGLINGAALGTTELHVLRARSNLNSEYLFYITISSVYRKTGEALMYGAGGQKRVPPEFSKDFLIPLPPLDEQIAIADFLDRETARIDGMVAKVETAIERLLEYRAALITAAVTGKIDVRAANADNIPPGNSNQYDGHGSARR